MTKVLAIIMLALICMILFPIGIGLIGGAFGLVFGVFGAVFGAIGGILGGIFGAIFGVFGSIFEGIFGWDCPRFFAHNNVFSIVVLAIVVAIVIKQRKPTPR